jgi:hypothetical protein
LRLIAARKLIVCGARLRRIGSIRASPLDLLAVK